MQNNIPMLSIVAMAVAALIGLAIPVVLYVVFRKKGANHLPFWIGCITFVLFALVLERLVYVLLMKLPLWTAITGNVWIYGLVGGLMAGVFEETGRLVAFVSVLRKKRGNDVNALMYGAGHGGIEAVILMSATMVINLIFSLQSNAGIASPLGTASAALSLAATPSWMFLAGAVERLSAVAIHVSLSVLVWFAAKNSKKFWLFPLAILLHLLVDAVAVILSGSGVNVWIIEAAVFVITVGLVFLAIAVWKKNHVAPMDEPTAEETPAEQISQAQQ